MPPYWPDEKYCTFKVWQLQQLLMFQRQILPPSSGLSVCQCVTKQKTTLWIQIMAKGVCVSITRTSNVVNFCPGLSDESSTFGWGTTVGWRDNAIKHLTWSQSWELEYRCWCCDGPVKEEHMSQPVNQRAHRSLPHFDSYVIHTWVVRLVVSTAVLMRVSFMGCNTMLWSFNYQRFKGQ
jgi:hypothetical protein